MSFSKVVENYIKHIDSLYDTFPFVCLILDATNLAESTKYTKFIDENGVEKEDDTGEKTLIFTGQNRRKFLDLQRKFENSGISRKIVQNNFLVSLVSQYDVFLGNLIKVMYQVKPELLNGSDKLFSYSQLSSFENLQDAKEFIVEKEIEGVLRDSHELQFKWLENKLNIPLTKDLDSWKTFIEITERRNLFVHANGRVSSQYLSVCKKHQIEIDDKIKQGDILNIDREYFKNAYQCFFEIGTKLCHVVWRKLQSEKMDEADISLNEISFDLIKRKEYSLAIKLLEFASGSIKKHSSEENSLIFSINKAQAYKWSGNEEKCKSIISAIDWSAKSDKFKLVSYVLNDNFMDAYKTMKRIGAKDSSITKSVYQEWPIFKKIREEQQFRDLFLELFGEEYSFLNYDEDKIEKAIKDYMNGENGSLEDKEEKSEDEGNNIKEE